MLLMQAALAAQEENMGLVKLVLESQTKRNVQRLTQTYLTLSLQDIADAVGRPSAAAAELVILRCVGWAPGADSPALRRLRRGLRASV